MTTDDRLERVEKVMAAIGEVVESHERQLGLLIDLARAREAAEKRMDERIEKLVGGIGEFIRVTMEKPDPQASRR